MNRYKSLINETVTQGFTYKDIKNLKVVYGDRSNKFHLIDGKDRDYNTNFAMSLNDFLKTRNEIEAIKKLSGASIL